MTVSLTKPQLVSVAEDIEHFQHWWTNGGTVSNAEIRQGSAALRRLLVEDAAGNAWRPLGFSKTPTLQGPDLLAFYRHTDVELDLVVMAAAGGVRFAGIDTAFLGARRAHNPSTGIPARADKGFAVAVSDVARNAENPQPSELDKFIERTWYVHEYLDAPGLVRKGQPISRREVLNHMANEMGGVHVGKSSSELRDLLADAEQKLFVDTQQGELRTHYFEVLAMGQAVGRSADFEKLALTIRSQS